MSGKKARYRRMSKKKTTKVHATKKHTHTHTHLYISTHIQIYTHIYRQKKLWDGILFF